MKQFLLPLLFPGIAVVGTGMASVYFYATDDMVRAIFWLIAFGLAFKWFGANTEDVRKQADDIIKESERVMKETDDLLKQQSRRG